VLADRGGRELPIDAACAVADRAAPANGSLARDERVASRSVIR
jgi:hypothetical protein